MLMLCINRLIVLGIDEDDTISLLLFGGLWELGVDDLHIHKKLHCNI